MFFQQSEEFPGYSINEFESATVNELSMFDVVSDFFSVYILSSFIKYSEVGIL